MVKRERLGFIQGLDWRGLIFWAALTGGAAVRLYGLGRVPAGLNSDEASTGVEALSLLQTGMDRWGNRWPVWFPAWGSGMNALYTYIAIPVVAVFGLHVTTLRAIGAVFGVLTLPVAYYAARLHFGRDTALATVVLLAFLPWHVMSSRWALDSNLAPFLFTLGLFTLGKAVTVGGRWPVVAFIPWAIAIYAYPVTMVPSSAAGIAILYAFRRQVLTGWPRWLSGVAVAFTIALPFLLFLAKNQLHLDHVPFESVLPFSVPVLPATRLSQIQRSIVQTLFDNLTFIISGYRDGAVWHQSVYFLPLTGAAPFLTLLAAISLGRASYKARRPNLVLIVVLVCLVPICLLPLNVTRFNWFYIPSLMIVANMIVGAAANRKFVLIGSALYLATFLMLFYPYYFIRYNDEILIEDIGLGNGFRVGLEDKLRDAVARARPDEPILVDVGTVHPYLYVLFYGLGDIRSFQATRQVSVVDGVNRVSRFDRFVFTREAVPLGSPFVFVSRSNAPPCPAPEIMTQSALWMVGRCMERP